mgnify:FL=1|tara:strand:+ start:1288 stop:1686 length:399 start_codon:yes stop_codon:yes gene_type:complete
MKIKSSQELVAEALTQIETIDAKKVKLMIENNECTLVDIRDIREIWKEGTIKDSIHIPRGMLEFWLDPQSNYYKKDKFGEKNKMVLFCALGFRSALATKSLRDMGFKNTAHVNGGFDALKKAGADVIKKDRK